ncbi:DUF5363 family protein [Aeromonas jandaei]|uniref:DUF5363 family protein n=1 Tax=Aeromonas jandaei TaxID=650 RepID=UPI003BA20ECF
MKGVLLRWLARYDEWCEEWGLTQENRRCCTPVRYDEDPSKECNPGIDDSLTENCGSRHR